jgi:hypothetical protein
MKLLTQEFALKLLDVCFGWVIFQATRYLAVLSILLLQLPAHAQIVAVSSSYSDEFNQKKISLKARGALLRYRERFLILTASHVSQGSDLRISTQGETLKIVGRAADIHSDIELIEVNQPSSSIQPLASWAEDIGYFEVDPNESWNWNRIIETNRRNGFKSRNPGFIQLDWWEILLTGTDVWSSDEIDSVNQNFYQRFFLNGQDLRTRQDMGWTLGGNERSSAIKLKPGTSGAPILRLYQGKKRPFSIIVTGVATRTQRYSEFSHFSSPDALRELVDQFRRAPKSALSTGLKSEAELRWAMKGGVTYRRNNGPSSWSEISPLTQSVALQSAEVIGNGSSVDGGSGTSANSGQGFATLDPFQMTPGLAYHGQPTLGFEVKNKRSNQTLLLNASISTLALLSKHSQHLTWKPMVQHQNTQQGHTLFGIFQSKVQMAQGKLSTSRTQGALHCNLNWNSESLELSVEMSPGVQLQKQLDARSLTTTLYTDESKTWAIDLTEIFLLEPSYNRLPFSSPADLLNIFGMTPKQRFERLWLELTSASRYLSVRLRKIDAGAGQLGAEVLCVFELK